MSNIIVPSRRIWTRQPQGPVGIDWSNPIAPVLLAAALPAARRDLVSRAPFAFSNAEIAAGMGGLGFSQTSSASSSLGIPNPAHDLSAMTLVFVFSVNRRANYANWLASNNNNFLFASGLNNRLLEWKIHGQAWGTRTSVFIGTLPASVDVGVHVIIAKWSAVENNGYGRLWFDGVELANSSGTPQTVVSNHKTQDSANIYLGTDENAGSKVYLWGKASAALPDPEIRSLSKNPWQIFKPRRRITYFDLGAGGSTLNATASGGGQAAGDAALAAQVALAGIGVAIAGGQAAATVGVPLAAAGIAVAGGQANPQATITLTAAGLAAAAGQAGLSASVLAQAAGAALAAGNAELAAQLNALASGAAQAAGSASLTGGAPGSLAAAGQAIAQGGAGLSVTVQLQASGAAVASGSAGGAASAPGQIAAGGSAVAGGAAVASATVMLTAAGFVQAMGAGVWSASIPLAAFGGGISAGSGVLSLVPDGMAAAVADFLAVRRRESLMAVPVRRLFLRG